MKKNDLQQLKTQFENLSYSKKYEIEISSLYYLSEIALIENKEPILATDPWIGDEDPAYFGSWVCSHEIPESYKKDILNSKYIWKKSNNNSDD